MNEGQPRAIILRICSSCIPAPDPGAARRLQSAIEAAELPVRLLPQPCMNGCAGPVTLALQGQGRATYFFNGIDVDGDRDDIIATIRAYHDSPAGWIEDAEACGRLRFCLTGRVPALPEGCEG